MCKTINDLTPDYLRSRFIYRDNVNAYRVKSTENKLVLPQSRTDYLKDVRTHCHCALLLRTQIHTPRHTSRARAKQQMNIDREDGHCYSFAWI